MAAAPEICELIPYNYRTLREGDETRIDDDIALWFTRKLAS